MMLTAPLECYTVIVAAARGSLAQKRALLCHPNSGAVATRLGVSGDAQLGHEARDDAEEAAAIVELRSDQLPAMQFGRNTPCVSA